MTTEFTPTGQGRQADKTYPSAWGRLPRLPLGAGIAAVAAAVLLTACSSGSSTAPATGGAGGTAAAAGAGGASGTSLSTGQASGVGTVLTDQSSMTVYEAQQEAGGKIMCTGSCLSFWYPVTVGSGVTPHVASAITGKLGTIKRSDNGATQLTVNGQPLYTFRQDSGPGSAMGNNFSDSFGSQSFTWHALTAAGAAAPAAAPNNTPTSSSYGY
jgi:predicted lipoprotein with Yx(FWY)xxD motif